MYRPECKIELVTPAMAKEWLGLNHRNRRLSDPVVHRLGGAITRGEWMVSTDAIGLDSDGGVVNGQHRLQAIIETGVGVEMVVLHGVDPNIIRVIDQGMGRSFATLLSMDGRYSNPAVIAGGVDWLYRTLHNLERSYPTSAKATVPQLLELFEEHKNITGSVDPALEASRLGVPRAMLAGLHYQAASVNPDAAADFFDRLATGLDVADDDPVYALREKIITNAKREKPEKDPIVCAWIIKAWEATVRGEALLARNLKFVYQGSRAEPYPKISNIPWMVDHVDEDAA